MKTVLLLTISNIFMTFAWYGHLKFKESPLWIAIVVSWMIAFLEYCFQVPANGLGSSPILNRPVEDNSGSHHPRGVFGFLP